MIVTHTIKIIDKSFFINNIIVILKKKHKRFNYNEKKIRIIKVAKNFREVNINTKDKKTMKVVKIVIKIRVTIVLIRITINFIIFI